MSILPGFALAVRQSSAGPFCMCTIYKFPMFRPAYGKTGEESPLEAFVFATYVSDPGGPGRGPAHRRQGDDSVSELGAVVMQISESQHISVEC